MRLLAAGAATVDAFVGKSREQGKETGFHSAVGRQVGRDPSIGASSLLSWHSTVFRAIYTTLPPRRLSWHMEMITFAAAAAKSLQSCPTLCNPRDGSPPGSPVPGILQARTLEWVAIAFSNV